MLKVGLAGFAQGYYAVHYSRWLAAQRGVQLAAMCDFGQSDGYISECAFVNAGDFARELGAELVHSPDALLAGGIDAVLVCDETHRHIQLAQKALARGIHTFVAKPLGTGRESPAALENLAGGRAVLLCGNPLLYEPALLQARQTVRDGQLGEVYDLRLSICHEAMVHQAWERDETRSGGNLGTYAPYLFGLPAWLTGQPLTGLAARAGNYNTPQITTPDTLHVLAGLRGGGTASLSLYCGIRAPQPFYSLSITGTKGACTVTAEENADFAHLGPAEMEHFCDCIRGTQAPRCGLAEMGHVFACVRAVKASLAAGGKPTKVEGA